MRLLGSKSTDQPSEAYAQQQQQQQQQQEETVNLSRKAMVLARIKAARLIDTCVYEYMVMLSLSIYIYICFCGIQIQVYITDR